MTTRRRRRIEDEEEELELEKRVLETVKACQVRNERPLVWAIELSKCVGRGDPELAEVLVSHLCFSNNSPSLWKCLHLSLSSSLIYPPHLLSLLSSRVIPHRRSQPGAFRLYLELLSRFPFSFHIVASDVSKLKIIQSIDHALQLSQTYGVQARDLGFTLVLYFFSIVVGLIDSMMDDWGLQTKTFDAATAGSQIEGSHNMDIDFEGKRYERHEQIKMTNTTTALGVLAELMEKQKAVVLLRLIHLNLPEKFNTLLQKLQFLEDHLSSSSKLKSSSQLLLKLSANIRRALVSKCDMRKSLLIGMLTDVQSCVPASCYTSATGRFPCWVPFDVCMETAMDGKQFPVTSAIDILTETITTLQIFNGASWQETFLALWLSALRLVQRERDPLEGPVPHLDARLCILLSITPLAIAQVLADNSKKKSPLFLEGKTSRFAETEGEMSGMAHASKRRGLVSALQLLGIHPALLCPPASSVIAANKAVSKAASFICKMKNMKYGFATGDSDDTLVKAGGDLRHLIVEACIARKLVDTSAYLWPGYVPASLSCVSDPSPLQRSPWSTFMEGAPLTGPLINALVSTPASSLAEIEKLHHIALNGIHEEKSAAAKIICGASLVCGWNIQEHVVRIVVKLLSPPEPANYMGSMSHLVDYLPMLSSILFGVTSIDTVHILSLHGMVPEVAASLIPVCEAFGSLEPLSSRSSSTYDESVYMVFSYAFLFLLRLWKFYRPPLEQCITGRGGVIGGELTLEYLLLLRNSRIQSFNRDLSDGKVSNFSMQKSVSTTPIYIDAYPKLRAWYCQNKSCIASTLSGVCIGNPVHQVANKILNMIFWKMTKNGSVSSNTSTAASSIPSDSSDVAENPCQAAVLPAWEVLEAIPYVLEAILTACAHGRLSSRDLTTGLRDLVDFLPASLAAIISYFSAEITRGTWKPVLMNGMDWPSPAANFLSVESEIKEILAAAGVKVPSCSSGISEAMLPLPMAALVSLTITFKLDKSLEYIQAVVGPALENCASNCAWPSMPIVSSLWAQKVRRWNDFIVVSCSRSIFRQDQEAVAQLLRSCFTSFLGSVHNSSPLMGPSGVNGLLGSFISARGICPPVAPGFLYLRSCRMIQNVRHVNNVIVGFVGEFAREVAASRGNRRLRSTPPASLAVAAARAKEMATLGASLLYVAGGLELVQELYKETIPTTWLLSSTSTSTSTSTREKGEEVNSVSKTVEGYAMAYLLVLSGALAWGVDKKQPSEGTISRRACMVGVHMDFVAEILEGNISIGCDPVTWKAYVCSLVGLVVRLAPLWLQQVKVETLRKLANGLREWQEFELAMLLLERGGIEAMSSIVELLKFI